MKSYLVQKKMKSLLIYIIELKKVLVKMALKIQPQYLVFQKAQKQVEDQAGLMKVL